MSANPAVSIFALLTLQKEKALRDAAAFPAELKSAMKGMALEIPLAISAANLQLAYDKAVKSITVSPINVPVNFVPGGMPGMGGMGGAGGLPTGASSPNWSYLMRNQGGGPGGGGAPGTGGGGGGGGMGGMFRVMMGIHGIMALGNEFGRREKESMDLDRTVTYGSGEEKDAAMKHSVKSAYEKDHSNILTYGISRLATKLGWQDDSDHAMDTDAAADKQDRKTKKMKTFADATAQAFEASKELNLRTKNTGASEDDKSANTLADERRKMEKRIVEMDRGYNGPGESAGARAERASFNSYEAATKKQTAQHKSDRADDLISEAMSTESLGRGATDEAALTQFKEKQRQEYRGRKEKFGAGEADAYKSTVQDPELVQFQDKQRREREKEEADSAARITDIYGAADEQRLKSTGAVYAAMESSTKRHIDDQIGQLKRLENEQIKGSKKQLELHNEVIAAQAAGVTTLGALRAGAGRDAELAQRDAGQDLDTAGMDAGGHHREARQKAIRDKYENEAQKIIEEQNTPEVTTSKLRTAEMKRDAATQREESSRVAPNTAMAIQGQDAAARSHGQEGVGGVLSFGDEIRKKYQDAGGDKAQAKLVDDYRDSEVAARKRELRPKDAGMKYGGAEYHDVLQQQINTGYGHGEAMKKLMVISGMDVSNAGTPEGAMKGAAKDLSDVVKKFDSAVDQMNRRKTV